MITSIHMATQVQAYLNGDVQTIMSLIAESVAQYCKTVVEAEKPVQTEEFDRTVSRVACKAIATFHPDLEDRLDIKVARAPDSLNGRLEIKLHREFRSLLVANPGACYLQ
jgi:hypothetical protein